MDLAFPGSLLLSPSSERSSSSPITVLPVTLPKFSTLCQSTSTLGTLSPDQNGGPTPNLAVHQPLPDDRRKRHPRVQPAAAGVALQLSEADSADGAQWGAAAPTLKERTLLCAVCGDEAIGYGVGPI